MKNYDDKSFWLATYGEYIPNPAIKGGFESGYRHHRWGFHWLIYGI